jgi:alpha-beta hydrolase superfamily lysophospholipase
MTESLTTDDGLALHLRHWPAQHGAPRATVLIVHGLGEHVGRYAHVAQWLGAHGYATVGYDQRGHGRSGGARGRLAAPDDPQRDLGRVVEHARRHGGDPLVLLGHSAGGSVAARYVAEGLAPRPAAWFRPVDALALSSPAFDPGMSVAQKALLAVLGPIAPNLAVGNGVDPSCVSRDPDVVAAYTADPLVHDRVTPRLARWLLDAGARVLADAPAWRVPTLLMYAGADRCIAPAGSRRFAAAAPAGVVATHAFPTLYHEILNEPEQREVLETLGAWLDARFPPPA